MKNPTITQHQNKPGSRADDSILPSALRPGLFLTGRSLLPLTLLSLLISLVIIHLTPSNVSASSVTLSIPSSALSLDIKPNSGTVFQKSSAGIINVATDSSYGYSLSIHAKNGDSDSTKSNDLLNGSNKIASIVSALNESDFQNSGANNTWGYLPSKLNSSANTDFQPGPTSEPTTLDVTDSSSSGTDYDITLATKIDNTLPAGTYHNTFILTTTINDPPYDDIIQNWTGCNDLPEETKTLTLLDTRDNKTYTVAKLKDDNCWMTKNLEIGKESEETKLTPEDSDITSDFTLPSSSTSGFSSYDVSNVYIDSQYGGYYTWFAATAGEGTQAKTGETSQSICPKGWRLPTKDEYTALATTHGGDNATGGKALQASPANFLKGGVYNRSSPFYVGSSGYYWSSTVASSNTNNANELHVSDSSANPSDGRNKSDGFSVRCVTRYDKKVDTLQNVADWADSIEENKTALSKDSRDDKEYTVSRLADGKLWMTQNLAIENYNLTSADSDVASNFQIPASSTNGFSDNAAANVYVDSQYGGYYTWIAATAGTGSSATSDGAQASGSVCPKGWRLPSKQDFINLDKALGGNGTNGQNNSSLVSKYQASSNNFKMGGNYSNSSPNGVSSRAGYWSSTVFSSTNAYYLYFNSSGTVDPFYDNARYNGRSVRCISRTDDPIGTMQNVSEWADSVEKGKTVRATDTRDNKEYTVARLEDGKLWMTKNLEIAGKTLTSTDSDVSGSYSLPASSTSGFSGNTSANVYVDSQYGGYYTWIAATAGTGSSVSTNGQDATGSVCPKGWKLPTKDEYTALATAYGGDNANGSSALRTAPAIFVYAGYYNSGSPSVQGSNGLYWSSTTYSSTSAWYFYLISSGAHVGGRSRDYGSSVRCISRTDDPLPVLQNVSEWGASIATEQEVKAVDSRDNKEYTVARLKDNKLWITKNLEIENYTLTSADSDVASDFQIPASTDKPNSSNSYESKELHIDETYGGYYTWYTATAGEGTQDVSTNGQSVKHSICPKDWRLPTKDDFIALDKALGGTGLNRGNDSALTQKYRGVPNNFKMGGFYAGGSETVVGVTASYWSSTTYNSDNAYYSYFDSSNIEPQKYHNKYISYSVRCISRQ